jgi:hypothetical protein
VASVTISGDSGSIRRFASDITAIAGSRGDNRLLTITFDDATLDVSATNLAGTSAAFLPKKHK